MTSKKAAAIAVSEVKNREGWSGEADSPVLDGDRWLINVWAMPKTPGGFRTIQIGQDGSVQLYQYGK
jgi:hypothetical protein